MRNIRNIERGSRKGVSTGNRGREVPSAVITRTGETRERRAERIEDAEVI
jgi:hypothetical protein